MTEFEMPEANQHTEWWLQVVAVIIAIVAFVIALHSWNTIESHGDKGIGETGDVGPIGFFGPRGSMGIMGPRGPFGPTGPTGGTGPPGPTGITGQTGGTGPTGGFGQQGIFGPPTYTGPSGPTGFVGFPSPNGPMGPSGANAQTGPTGSTGLTGTSQMPYLFATYSLGAKSLQPTSTSIAVPLVTNAGFILVQEIDHKGNSFGYNQGAISFSASNSLEAAFGIRVSVSGRITGGHATDTASLSFPSLPISTNVNWIVGASYNTGTSAHLFSSTILDTLRPISFGNSRNLSFNVILSAGFQSPNLLVDTLTLEIAQLSR